MTWTDRAQLAALTRLLPVRRRPTPTRPHPAPLAPGAGVRKVHLVVDGRGLPMSIVLIPGEAGDNPQLLPLLDQINVGRDGPGRPRTRPDRVVADKVLRPA
jgi:hypothetical protein